MLKTSDTGLDLVNNLVPINGIYQTIIFRRGEHGLLGSLIHLIIHLAINTPLRWSEYKKPYRSKNRFYLLYL